jgi:hypothetical protein
MYDLLTMEGNVPPPTSVVPIQIRQEYDTSKIKDEFWYCECGSKEMAKILGIHDDWALWMVCQNPCCQTTWYVCNRCPDSRKKITDREALKRHNKQQHRKNGGVAGKKRKSNNVAVGNSLSKRGATTDVRETSTCQQQEDDKDDFLFVPSDEDNDVQKILDQHTKSSLMPQENNNTNLSSMFSGLSNNDICWSEGTDPWQCFASSGSSEKSLIYFQHCHVGGRRAGVNYLVRRSIMGKSIIQNEELQKMDTPDSQADLLIEMAMLCFDVTSTLHPRIANLFNGLWRMGCEDGLAQAQYELNRRCEGFADSKQKIAISRDLAQQEMSVSIPFEALDQNQRAHIWGAPMPMSSEIFRSIFRKNETSIINNLPVPTIKKDVQGHAYVSIIDCIRNFFAHGNSQIAVIPDVTKEGTVDRDETPVRHCSESKRAQEILARGRKEFSKKMKAPPICSYLIFWSDDFEPNALSKSGRGSAWVKTMTIATTKENGHKTNNTYTIAMGRKGLDHDPVEQKINEELKLLQEGTLPPFYIGTTKKCVHVYFELLATLQDQPERRSANHLGMGNAKYTTRFGVSADHDALYSKLKSCATCLEIMSQRFQEGEWDLPLPNCTKCLNWDVLTDSSLARTPVHKNYPEVAEGDQCRTVTVDGQRYLKPFRIEYESLAGSLFTAHNQYAKHDGWSLDGLRQYLKVEGLNKDIIDKIEEHAINAKAVTVEQCDEASKRILLDDRMRNPGKYERLEHPPLWKKHLFHAPLSTHIDVIMHLLFLGLVKVVIHSITLWLKSLNKHNSFLESNAKFLDKFKAMSIDWLAVLPYTGGKLGAWVSENYLGFSRISLWFYQNIEEAPAVNQNEPPDNLQPKFWTSKHNKYWLKERGLDTEGKANDLKTRVRKYMEMKPVPKPLFQAVRKVEDVQDTIFSLVNVLQCVMASEVTASLVSKTEYAIRIFLSAFDKLNISLPKDKSKRKTKAGTGRLDEGNGDGGGGREEGEHNEGEEQVTEENDSEPLPQEVNQKVTATHNCMCLLNIPTAMATYGPLRDLWEGGPRGEGILRTIKPLLQQGLTQNWEYNLLAKVHIKQQLQNLLVPQEATITPSVLLCSPESLKDRSRNFHKYKTLTDATVDVKQLVCCNKHPVSVILLNDGKENGTIYCVVNNYDTVVEISRDPSCPTINKFGLTYHKFTVAANTLEWEGQVIPTLLDTSAKIGYGILLPLLNLADNTERSRMFALASSNWLFLTQSNTILDLIDNN